MDFYDLHLRLATAIARAADQHNQHGTRTVNWRQAAGAMAVLARAGLIDAAGFRAYVASRNADDFPKNFIDQL